MILRGKATQWSDKSVEMPVRENRQDGQKKQCKYKGRIVTVFDVGIQDRSIAWRRKETARLWHSGTAEGAGRCVERREHIGKYIM